MRIPRRIFVYEHITGGGLYGQILPVGLKRDGERMLRALVDDLARCDVEIAIARDARLDPISDSVRTIEVGPDLRWEEAWSQGLDWADAVWPIAPETGGLLLALSERIQQAGRILLGSRPDALAIASSKERTYRCLHHAGLNAIPTQPVEALPECFPSPWVVKPDDGAGCEDTFLLAGRAQLETWRRLASNRQYFVAQPYVAGRPASLSLVCADGNANALTLNQQHIIVSDRHLEFRGTSVYPRTELTQPARRSRSRGVRCLTRSLGLCGDRSTLDRRRAHGARGQPSFDGELCRRRTDHRIQSGPAGARALDLKAT